MKKSGRYYEMPMAIAARIVATVVTVVAFRITMGMRMAMLKILVALTVSTRLLDMLLLGLSSFDRRGSFDMDMGNVVVRMAVP
jgi:hypothetical protein